MESIMEHAIFYGTIIVVRRSNTKPTVATHCIIRVAGIESQFYTTRSLYFPLLRHDRQIPESREDLREHVQFGNLKFGAMFLVDRTVLDVKVVACGRICAIFRVDAYQKFRFSEFQKFLSEFLAFKMSVIFHISKGFQNFLYKGCRNFSYIILHPMIIIQYMKLP